MNRMECRNPELKLLVTLFEDGTVVGDSGMVKDLKRHVDSGGLHEMVWDTHPGEAYPRFTPLGDPLFLYRMANYLNKQTCMIRFTVYP